MSHSAHLAEWTPSLLGGAGGAFASVLPSAAAARVAAAGNAAHRGPGNKTPSVPRAGEDPRRPPGTSRTTTRALQERLRPLAQRLSVAYCGIGPQKTREGLPEHIAVLRHAETGHASFGNVQHCRSPWACPSCAERMRAQRGEELTAAGRAHGWDRVELVTLTVRHGKGDDLRALRSAVSDCWRRVQQRRGWRDYARENVFGDVRCLEVMWGPLYGWHPHLHLLVFMQRELTDLERHTLKKRVFEAWAAAVKRALGAEYVPDFEHGIDVTPAHEGTYLAKMGLEGLGYELADGGIAKEGNRGHLTPWQIAWRASWGNDAHTKLWTSYQLAMRGAKQLTWSKAVKALVTLAEEERAEPDEVARIDLGDWTDVVRSTVEQRPARLYILECVEKGADAEEVACIVAQCVEAQRARRGLTRTRSWPGAQVPLSEVQPVEVAA